MHTPSPHPCEALLHLSEGQVVSSPLTTCCYPDNVLLTAGNDIVARVYALPTPARGRGRGRSAVSAWVEREILLLGVAMIARAGAHLAVAALAF